MATASLGEVDNGDPRSFRCAISRVPKFRPGDFELGSLESRAAARAMLDHLQQQRRVRVFIERIGDPGPSQDATCHRYLTNGLVVEILYRTGRLHDNEMEELVRRRPIDGKTHTFAELRGQSS